MTNSADNEGLNEALSSAILPSVVRCLHDNDNQVCACVLLYSSPDVVLYFFDTTIDRIFQLIKSSVANCGDKVWPCILWKNCAKQYRPTCSVGSAQYKVDET